MKRKGNGSKPVKIYTVNYRKPLTISQNFYWYVSIPLAIWGLNFDLHAFNPFSTKPIFSARAGGGGGGFKGNFIATLVFMLEKKFK